MKRGILLLILIISSVQLLYGQKLKIAPEETWEEYLKLNPTKQEFVEMLYGLDEPYKAWCAQEILNGDPDNKDLRFLVEAAPRKYAEIAWRRLLPKAEHEDLIDIMNHGYTDAHAEYKEMAFQELFKQNLSLEELRDLITWNVETHEEEIWDRFIKEGPSPDDLIYVYARASQKYMDKSLDEILNSGLTTQQLSSLFSRQVEMRENGSEKALGLLAAQLLGRQDLDSMDLHHIENYAPEPYSTIAHETRESTGELGRDKLRRVLCPKCGFHSEKEDIQKWASAEKNNGGSD